MKNSFILLAMLCPLLCMCQLKMTIKGKLINEEGEPIAGATIRLASDKDNKNVKLSDAKGAFVFTGALIYDTVLVTAAGYLPATEPNNERGILTITLKHDVRSIGEVIVSTGYQQLPKERATGSFALVNQEQLSRVPSLSLLERLDGISNILFDKRNGEDVKLQLRGLYTLTTSITQPLIVVDNFPYEGDIQSLNPNDVESVTLLKDAAAASVWGAKAGNGVIVITTKKGRFNQPAQVSFTFNSSITAKPNLMRLPQLSSNDIIDLELFLFSKGFYDADINNTSTRPPLSPLVEMLVRRRAGYITAADSAMQVQAFRKQDVRRDFEKYMYNAASSQQYALNINGGSPKHSYQFSVGYDKVNATLAGDNQRRFTLRSGHTFRFTNRFTATSILSFTQGWQENNSPGAYGSFTYQLGSRALPRYASLVNPDGTAAALATRYRQTFTDTVGGGKLLDWKYRPLDELNMADNRLSTQLLLADLNLQYRLTSFLMAEAQYRYQRNQSLEENAYSIGSYYARDLINLYTNLAATSATTRNPVPVGGILDRRSGLSQSHNGRAQLSLDYPGDDYRIAALAGAEVRETRSDVYQNRVYGYDQRLDVAAVDYKTSFPRIIGSQAVIPYETGIDGTTDRFVSLYANAAFTWKRRYTFSGSARRDASNLFGINANDKWSPFWSAGAAWDIAAEPFFKSKSVTQMRARLSYGFSGNVDQSRTAFTLIRFNSSASNSPVFFPYAQVISPPNPDLRWERVRTLNAAVDFRYKDWLSGSVEYYRKRSTDVLAGRLLDPTTGFNSVAANTAHITGAGAELQLTAKWLRKGGINWQTDFLFNYASYKVTRYLLDLNTNGYTSSGVSINPIEGYNPYLIVSYRWGGLDPANGNPLGYADGRLSTDYTTIKSQTPFSGQVIHGPALPPFFGNLLNSISYKRTTLSFNIIYQLGHYLRKPAISYSSLFASGDGIIDYLERWRQPGDEIYTNVPSMIYPNPSMERDAFYANSEVNVIRAGFVRLYDCRVSHMLSLDKPKARPFQANLFVYASNLNMLLWRANDEGIDPLFPGTRKPPVTVSFGVNMQL